MRVGRFFADRINPRGSDEPTMVGQIRTGRMNSDGSGDSIPSERVNSRGSPESGELTIFGWNYVGQMNPRVSEEPTSIEWTYAGWMSSRGSDEPMQVGSTQAGRINSRGFDEPTRVEWIHVGRMYLRKSNESTLIGWTNAGRMNPCGSNELTQPRCATGDPTRVRLTVLENIAVTRSCLVHYSNPRIDSFPASLFNIPWNPHMRSMCHW